MAFPSYIFYLRDSFTQKTNTSLFFAVLLLDREIATKAAENRPSASERPSLLHPYCHLTQFNPNKKYIKQVLNDQKCQLRLQTEGLSTLNNLINQTTQKITSFPRYDNCEYSYIFFNNKKQNKTYLKLKK